MFKMFLKAKSKLQPSRGFRSLILFNDNVETHEVSGVAEFLKEEGFDAMSQSLPI